MRKVFINDRPLVFLVTEESIPANNFTIIHCVNSSSIERSKALLNLGKATGIYLLCDDLEKCWTQFKASYRYIVAAGGLVTNETGELLMIFRLGKWDLPKGKLEKGESIAEAAVREVEEECGITAPVIIAPLPSTFHTYTLKGQPALKESFWFRMKYSSNEPLVPQIEEDITKIKWVKPHKVQKLLPKAYAAIADLVSTQYLPTV